jgi:hypothetical protein
MAILSDLVLPIIAPMATMSKRSRETSFEELQARPPKRQCEGLESSLDYDASQIQLYQRLDANETPTIAPQLCEDCRKLQLGKLLSNGSKALAKIGKLGKRFEDPDCQLCSTIRFFVEHYWKLEWPVKGHMRRMQVHIKSKKWCSYQDPSPSSSQLVVNRILLGVNKRPQNLPLMRRRLNHDKWAKFVLTELELDPTKPGIVPGLPSLRRPIQPHINRDLVRGWLEECRNHEKCKNRISHHQNLRSFFQGGFRLIDVVEERLVEKTEPCAYVALSYVWGDLEPSPLCTKRENLTHLSQPGSLHPRESRRDGDTRIPRTITDTISLCRDIGLQYLWVDSLCIVQNDPEEKRRLIHGMDRVYEFASQTIIALSGEDANAGLAGISARGPDNYGRGHLFDECCGTHRIAIGRVSLREQIRSSTWSTRGWTYQEQLLSGPKLYFTPHELFYECGQHMRREGYKLEQPKSLDIRQGAPQFGRSTTRDLERLAYTVDFPQSVPSNSLDSRSLRDFDENLQDVVQNYTWRKLKEPGDIVNALIGIYNKYFTSTEHQDVDMHALQGIPMRSFSKSLLWFTASQNEERRISGNGPVRSTWSWTSRIGPIEFASTSFGNFPATKGWYAQSFSQRQFACSMSLIDEWCLSYRNGSAVSQVRFSCHSWDGSDSGVQNLVNKEVNEILEMFSNESRGNFPNTNGLAMPGVLSFLAPYIPKPTATGYTWTKTPEGEWILKFGPNEFDIFAYVRLDSGEDTIDAFVLLFYDTRFWGLCVRQVDDCFEKVGVAMFTRSKQEWESLVDNGSLNLYWEQILLR